MKTILKTIAGSKLHGTDVPGVSDTDYLGVFLESPDRILGYSQKDTITHRDKPQGEKSETNDEEETLYGLRKFTSLALAGNPTILTLFFAPRDKLIISEPEGLELQKLYPSIVSKKVMGPFQGYMKQQYERLIGERGQKNVVRPELVAKYGYDTKYAGHIVRLGLQGIEVLRTGKMTLPMKSHEASLVLAVREGAFSFKAVCTLIQSLEQNLKLAYNSSSLREEPNYREVEDFMIKTYLNYWNIDEKIRDKYGTIKLNCIAGDPGLCLRP